LSPALTRVTPLEYARQAVQDQAHMKWDRARLGRMILTGAVLPRPDDADPVRARMGRQILRWVLDDYALIGKLVRQRPPPDPGPSPQLDLFG
jgi:hypothetical protein